ncbi:MAG: adenylate/guanylate cyclase domain-containing protein [Deltaproteobacteria bacterium]|nr:adenylate/guanylate cyclase domain-containing protein [Deltaproteobacteria bacterium]
MSRLFKILTLGFLTGLLGLILSPILFDLEKNIGLDLLFKLRGSRKVPSDIIIVAMDKATSDKLHLPTDPGKWPRCLHAELIANLLREGARVVVFDIIFDNATEYDTLFARAIANASNVVLCEWIKKETIPLSDKKGGKAGEVGIEKLESPTSILAQAALALAPFPLPKTPIRVSQYWLIKTGGLDAPTLPVVAFQIFALDVYDEFLQLLKEAAPSLSEKLPGDRNAIIEAKNVENVILTLRNFFESNPLIAEKILDKLKNENSVSIAPKKKQLLKSFIKMHQGPISRYLNFYGPPRTISTVPYYRMLQTESETTFNKKMHDVKGKAVFIGLSEQLRPQHKDGFHTVFSQTSGLALDISGVEIAATAFANLLEDMPVKPLGLFANLTSVFVWGLVIGSVCMLLSPVISALSSSILGVLYVSAAYYQFKHTAVWYPLVVPLMFQVPFAFFGTVLWKYFDKNREEKNVKKAFGYYLPDNVVDQLIKNRSTIKTEAQIVYGTCLITDAERYTTLSETIDPQVLSNFMNEYYNVLFKPVRQYKGTVSDVIGDSMLALWSTTEPDTAIRNNACLAALSIAKAIYQFNQSSGSFQLPTRIALHSGHMSIGNIGAIDHYEYRPIGDIVNTVSRLEGLNKYLGTYVLASEEVLKELNDFLTRELGKFLLAGKSKPIVVYELLSLVEESTEKQRKLCATFEKALNAYRRQSWDAATDIFYESTKISKHDGPSIFYLELCKKYRDNPPGEIWDGLVHVNNK